MDDKLLLKMFDRAFQDNAVIDRKEFNHRLSRLGMDLIKDVYKEMEKAGWIYRPARSRRVYNKKDRKPYESF